MAKVGRRFVRVCNTERFSTEAEAVAHARMEAERAGVAVGKHTVSRRETVGGSTVFYVELAVSTNGKARPKTTRRRAR